jgi:two-component system invasion response regulator UvrY
MRILLVDDHPIVRKGIRTLLEEQLPGTTFMEAGDARGAAHLVRSAQCDLLITDISLPGPSGLDLIKEVRRGHPALPAIVVSIHSATRFARRALGAGAGAYLTKTSDPLEYVAAIDAVQHGRTYVSPSAGDESRDDEPSRAKHETLSDREYQVLRMLGAGRTVSAIARELSLSVKTVSTYRTRMLEKLGMQTSAELMRYAIENDLVE